LPGKEVKLADSRAERDLQDSLAEIFSIIVTLDELEKAFLKDAVPEADYTEICERSLKQYKSLTADEQVARAFGSLEDFKAEWEVIYAELTGTQTANADGRCNSSRSLAQPSVFELACLQLP